ncbi:RNA-binding protein [Anaeramoeba ignava]|uniref:RNA-binding protein n=1 Tax=Anaeramoeba ignava TaxID=1746090 RepID=A0A9Q0LKH9_ANAIG|nr:RNA-binding protein [Anaeramoeba ignava]
MNQKKQLKVYTICQESNYLIIENIPKTGVIKELIQLFALYGPILEYKEIEEKEKKKEEKFSISILIKFLNIDEARIAKKKLNERYFFGNHLNIKYAPNEESLIETKAKLEKRIEEVRTRLPSNKLIKDNSLINKNEIDNQLNKSKNKLNLNPIQNPINFEIDNQNINVKLNKNQNDVENFKQKENLLKIKFQDQIEKLNQQKTQMDQINTKHEIKIIEDEDSEYKREDFIEKKRRNRRKKRINFI